MKLGRREVFKMLGLTGAGVGASHLAKSLAVAQSMPGAAQTAASGGQKVEWAPGTRNGELGPADWPYQEIQIPFRDRKAKVKWPNGAKIALRAYVTAEWATAVNPEGSLYQPSLYTASQRSFLFNVGIYRALDVMEKYGIKMSCFPTGTVVPAFPNLFKEIHRLGHEVVARPARSPSLLPAEQQEPMIRQVTDSIAQVIGERPVGWIAYRSANYRTPEILANLGYLWTADHDGDDIPIGMRFGSKVLVAMPHRPQTMQDRTIMWTGLPVPNDPVTGFEFFRNTFDAIYLTATTEYPLTFIWGIHPDICCQADRIVWLDRCLSYMKGFGKDVWFARERDVAQYWKENYLT